MRDSDYYYTQELRSKEQAYLATAGEKCVNCGNWIKPPAVAFIIADSQRYPACVCGNPMTPQQQFSSIFAPPPASKGAYQCQ